MSKNISNQVQKESTSLPVSGKAKKGSSESCQNQVATIEQNSCETTTISVSDIVREIVRDSVFEVGFSEIRTAMANYEQETLSLLKKNLGTAVHYWLIQLRKERNEKVEFLRLSKSSVRYNYKSLPSYKVVKALRTRLYQGAKETDGFSFGYSSTSEGIKEVHKDFITYDYSISVLHSRVMNSLLMVKQHDREAKIEALKSVCESWIKLNITRNQAVEMNKTLNNSTLAAYIDYLDLVEKQDENKEE